MTSHFFSAFRGPAAACFMLPALAIGGSFRGSVSAGPPEQSASPAVAQAAQPSQRAAHAPATCAIPLAPRVANGAPRRIAFRSPASTAELAANVECLLRGSVRSGHWGVMAVSLSRADTLFALEAGSQFLPASTMKLLTAALAFDQLGPEHQFSTAVLRRGEVDSLGTLRGDLILQGGGDPTFSNRIAAGDSGAPMSLLAERVRAAGIARVTGALFADPSAFENRLVPDGWLDRYLDAPYAARVSALSLNGNVASVVIAPGESAGDAVDASLDPPASTMSVQNSVRVVAGSRGGRVAVRKVDDLTFEARGWIGDRSSPRRVDLVVEDPATFTAGAFRSVLALNGVSVAGATLVAHTPDGSQLVTSVPSPPLATLITAMNRESINHYAELIFRNSGRGADGLLPGSAAAGFSRLTDFLTTKVGADPGAVFAMDGSGLSVLNRVTPRALVQVLSHAHRAEWGPIFHSSLPVAGASATLRDRMRNSAAQGNLHAKTGTTSEVISLAGYVTAENGELLAFAFLYNGSDRDRARATIDEMGITLANLARR